MSGQAMTQDTRLAPAMQPAWGVEGAAAADAMQFITFAIGDDQYGIDIVAVREIKDWTPVRHLPEQPDYVRGICNLRGTFIPIVDLRCRFGQGLTQPTPHHVFIIVQIGAQQVGLLADRVCDIVSVARADIKPVPDVGEARALGFLSGLANVDDAPVGLIELGRILDGAREAADQHAAAVMLDA